LGIAVACERVSVALQPTKLSLDAEGQLVIDWNDGLQQTYNVNALRAACPCATCREKRSQPPAPLPLLPVLSAAEARPLKLMGMKPVGHYAYSIDFSDGHDTGIFTFDLLREIGQASKAES
jgi:DUF971 family protein